jgi:hypothetical protein
MGHSPDAIEIRPKWRQTQTTASTRYPRKSKKEKTMKSFFTRRTVIMLTAAAAALFAAGSASAAAQTTQNASLSHLTKSAEINAILRAEIKTQLDYNPSGKVISSTEVSYDHGHVIVTVAIPGAGPDYTCPRGSTCIFEGADLKGKHASIDTPLSQNIHMSAYISLPVRSLHNRRSAPSWISNGTNSATCYPSGAVANSIGPPWKYYPDLYLQNGGTC